MSENETTTETTDVPSTKEIVKEAAVVSLQTLAAHAAAFAVIGATAYTIKTVKERRRNRKAIAQTVVPTETTEN